MYTVPIQLSKNILESKYEENSLSICLDYIHYLPLADTETLVKLLCSNSETVLFSAANPMQYEYVYKTIKWQSDWIKEFEKYDFKCYEIRDELSLYKFVPRHFKTNLLVFSKVEIGEEVTKPNLYYDKNDKIVEMG